ERALGRRLRVVDALGLDPQRLARAGDADTDDRAVDTTKHQRADAAGQLALTLDARDRADPRVAAVDLRHQEEPAIRTRGRVGGEAGFVGLEGQGHDHL